jgi:hypothetical protein
LPGVAGPDQVKDLHSMRSAFRRLAVPVVAVSLLASGQVAAQARAAHRPTTTITITASHHVSMASSVRPGTARLYDRSNNSTYLVRSRHGAGVTALVKDWNSSTSTGFERDFTTIAHMPSHSTVVTSLARGTYYAVDGEINRLYSSQVKRFSVSGKTWNVARPASVAVTIGSAQTMRSPATLPRHRFVHLVNNSAHPQQVVLYSYRATTAELNAFLAHPTLARLNQITTGGRALTFFDAHRSLYTDSRPAHGKYLIVNFSYGKGNTPRFTTGQAHLITVG